MSNNYHDLLDRPTNSKLDIVISKSGTKPIKNTYQAQQAIHDALFELQVVKNTVDEFDVCSMEALERVVTYLEDIETQQSRYVVMRLFVILAIIALFWGFLFVAFLH